MAAQPPDAGVGLGTAIRTAEGPVPVEYLLPGDRIAAHDGALVALARVVVHVVPPRQAVRVRPSVLDPEGRGRDFLLAARQRILVSDWRAQAIWHRPIALVAAGRLVDGAHIAPLRGTDPVRLFQLFLAGPPNLIELAQGRCHVAMPSAWGAAARTEV